MAAEAKSSTSRSHGRMKGYEFVPGYMYRPAKDISLVVNMEGKKRHRQLRERYAGIDHDHRVEEAKQVSKRNRPSQNADASDKASNKKTPTSSLKRRRSGRSGRRNVCICSALMRGSTPITNCRVPAADRCPQFSKPARLQRQSILL